MPAAIALPTAHATPTMINCGGIDEIDDRGARDREEADQIEDPVITEGITQRSRHSRGDEVAAVVEALIAADPCIKAPVANEAKTERRKRRRDDSRGCAERHLRGNDGRKLRMERDQQATG